jgi:hypothetical protein
MNELGGILYEIRAGLRRIPPFWRVVLVGGGVVAAIALLVSAFSTNGGDSSSTTNSGDVRQATYNALLEVARRPVREDRDLTCDPAFTELVIDQIDAPSSQTVFVEFAISDACKEAGEYDLAEYSPYYLRR